MAYDLTRPSDPDLAPGQARCPGPSTRDIVQSDGDAVPAALLAEQYEFLGDRDLGFERYTSAEVARQEMERLWPRTWQWACREEHIPEVGDWTVYDVGVHSFIVVRSEPDRIQAFYNSCPHRGMQICAPGSAGKGASRLRCPFHGISWSLDGSLRVLPCRWDFPHVDDEKFRLPEARVETWGGFVFINPDEHAVPLQTYLEVLPDHFRSWPLEDRYVRLHVEKVLPANWKMALEAFLEAFHVFATHSEGLTATGDANAQYDVFGENVTRFFHTVGHKSPHIRREVSENEMLKYLGAWDPDGPENQVPEGRTARTVAAAKRRVELGERFGVDLSGVSTSEMLDSIEYHVFPNACLFPGVALPMVYRFRPNGTDHDTCLHEILFLAPVPAEGPRPAPAEVYRLGEDDSYSTVPGFDRMLAFVYDQDTGNLRRQRDGAKGSKHGTQTLGNYQEVRIRRFHMTLDKYLEGA